LWSATGWPRRPDGLIFGPDPGPGFTWAQICEGARIVREEFSALGLPSYVKSTGSKGLHVMVPLEPAWEFGRIRGLCKAIVDTIVSRHPQRFVGKAAKDIRSERIFLDYLRKLVPYDTANVMLLEGESQFVVSAIRGYEYFQEVQALHTGHSLSGSLLTRHVKNIQTELSCIGRMPWIYPALPRWGTCES